MKPGKAFVAGMVGWLVVLSAGAGVALARDSAAKRSSASHRNQGCQEHAMVVVESLDAAPGVELETSYQVPYVTCSRGHAPRTMGLAYVCTVAGRAIWADGDAYVDVWAQFCAPSK